MDAVIILAVFIVTLILPFGLLGLKYWVYFWICTGSVLALWELVVYLRKGRTLSQRFWDWAREHKKEKWWIFAGMIVFWAALMGHLFLHD